jgi:hypothetical protein
MKNTEEHSGNQTLEEGTIESRINSNRFLRTNYAYGVWRAASEAKRLGYSQITAIEFGVAGGNGLIGLEEAAEVVKEQLGIIVKIYGFDTGIGMPEPLDYRDLPHIWKPGFFKMDHQKLRENVKCARVILGNVSSTIDKYTIESESPVGFISFDLDYYSSTKKALEIFDKQPETRLPRVFCWLDDTIGDHWETHCRFTGELLAIDEYNKEQKIKKITPINGLHNKLIGYPWWCDGMFVHHDFMHFNYTKHIYPSSNWELDLDAKD